MNILGALGTEGPPPAGARRGFRVLQGAPGPRKIDPHRLENEPEPIRGKGTAPKVPGGGRKMPVDSTRRIAQPNLSVFRRLAYDSRVVR